MRLGEATAELDLELLDAVGDFDRWPSLLERFADRFGAHGAGLLPALDPGQFRVTASMHSVFDAYVTDGVHLTDPRLKLASMLADNKVVDDSNAYSPQDMARMDYYQEWLPGQDLGPFAAIRGGSVDDPFVLALYRPVGERPFTPRDHVDMAQVSDRVMRAVALDKAVGSQVFAHRVDWHERSGAGIVGLARDGRVLFTGGRVASFLGAGLAIRHARLVFADAREERAVAGALAQSNAIAHAAALARPHARTLPERVYLRGRTDWNAFAAHAAQAAQAAHADMPTRVGMTALDVHPVAEAYRGFVACAHLVVLSDPFAARRADEAAYRTLWDLSAREAELVAHLVDGALLAEAAARMDIRQDSARTYLKSVYRKTGTRAQSELVARAARLLMVE